MAAEYESLLQSESVLSKQFIDEVKIAVKEAEKTSPDEYHRAVKYTNRAALLLVAHSLIFRTLNKKTFLQVWQLHKKVRYFN